MEWLDRIPLVVLIIAALTLGLAPFVPEPHLWEKLKMLAAARCQRPLDIFDLPLATPRHGCCSRRSIVRMATSR